MGLGRRWRNDLKEIRRSRVRQVDLSQMLDRLRAADSPESLLRLTRSAVNLLRPSRFRRWWWAHRHQVIRALIIAAILSAAEALILFAPLLR